MRVLSYNVEPSAAVGIAVALSEEFKSGWGSTKRVGVVLCGGGLFSYIMDSNSVSSVTGGGV
jgi:threonine dehydratase